MKSLTLLIAISIFLNSFTHAASNLSLKLEKNRVYKVQVTTEQSIDINMSGIQINTELKSASNLSFKPILFDTSYLLINIKYNSIILDMNAVGKNISINSNIPGNPRKNDEVMNNAVYNLCQNSLEVKMSFSGKVIEISNLEAVTNNVYKAFDSLPETDRQQMKSITDLIINPTALKTTIESITGNLPDKQVIKGDKWDTKANVAINGINLSILSSNKLSELEAGEATIVGESKIEPTGDGKIIMSGMDLAHDLIGIGTSEIKINPATGWIIVGKSIQKLQGKIIVNGNTVPLEVENKSEFTAIQ